eukprot:NODE_307_length_11332_cov_0.276774.p1 type:complete len:719 gc:universal NODE_307_length_11332_cov_0.276774:11106-8950(-)
METVIIPLHQKQKAQLNKILEDINQYQAVCAYLIPLDRNDKVLHGIQNFIKKFILHSISINAIELCGKFLNTKIMAAIDKLISYGNLQLFSLAHSQIGDDAFINLTHLNNLQVINLSDCKISIHGLRHFISLLLTSKQCWSRISLSGNDLRDLGVILFLESVSQQIEIRKIDLENVGATNHSVRVVISFLVDNTTCNHLNVLNNFISDSNVVEIKRITSLRRKLKSLDELISPNHNTASPVHLKLPYMYFSTSKRLHKSDSIRLASKNTAVSQPRLLTLDQVNLPELQKIKDNQACHQNQVNEENAVDDTQVLQTDYVPNVRAQLNEIDRLVVYLNGLKSRESNLNVVADNMTSILGHLDTFLTKLQGINIERMPSTTKTTQTVMHVLPDRTLLQQYMHPTKDSTHKRRNKKSSKIDEKSSVIITDSPEQSVSTHLSIGAVSSKSVQEFKSTWKSQKEVSISVPSSEHSSSSKSMEFKKAPSSLVQLSTNELNIGHSDSLPNSKKSLESIKLSIASPTRKSSSVTSIKNSINNIAKHLEATGSVDLQLHRINSSSIQYQNSYKSNTSINKIEYVNDFESIDESKKNENQNNKFEYNTDFDSEESFQKQGTVKSVREAYFKDKFDMADDLIAQRSMGSQSHEKSVVSIKSVSSARKEKIKSATNSIDESLLNLVHTPKVLKSDSKSSFLSAKSSSAVTSSAIQMPAGASMWANFIENMN